MRQPHVRMAQPCVILIYCLYLAKLIPVLHIGYIAQIVKRRNDDLEFADAIIAQKLIELILSHCEFYWTLGICWCC